MSLLSLLWTTNIWDDTTPFTGISHNYLVRNQSILNNHLPSATVNSPHSCSIWSTCKMRCICWTSMSPVSHMHKLSASNDGAKLETSRFCKQRSAQINLPFHSLGGQIRRSGGVVKHRLWTDWLTHICNLRVKNRSTIRARFTVNNTENPVNLSAGANET